jgi:hypothetical protein
MKKHLLAALLAAATATTATAGVIRHDRDDQAYLDLAAQTQFDPVGRLLFSTDQGRWICSGTVISYSYVLTAAHCLDDASTRDVSFTVGGESYTGVRWAVHENWWTSTTLFDGWDIAVLKVDRGIYNVGTAALYTGSDEIGQIGTHVGFGATGTGLNGQTLPPGTKRAGHNEIDEFDLAGRGHERVLWNDFDAPGDINPADMGPGTITDPSYLVNPIAAFGLMSGEALDMEYLIGGGDSGGGYFLQENGQWFLAGVHLFGASVDGFPNSTYGDFSGSSRVSMYVDWIEETRRALDVPEPSSIMLFGATLLGLFGFRRSKK